MSSVGVRELKEQTSEIVRRIRDEGESIDLTYRGEVFATIVPKLSMSPEQDSAFWEEHRSLVRAIGDRIGDQPVDTLALLDEERQEISPDEECDDWREAS